MGAHDVCTSGATFGSTYGDLTIWGTDSSVLIPGTYTVSITAEDADGGSDTCTFDLELATSSDPCESVILSNLNYDFGVTTVTAGQST